MPPVIYFFITIVVLVLASIAIYYIYKYTQKKYNDFVLQNSVSLKQLTEINERYFFHPYKNFNQSYTYDNENFFNTITCKDYLIYQLQYIRKELFTQIEKINTNKQQYSKYTDEVKGITQLGQFQSPIGKMRLDKLIKIEQEMIKRKVHHAPTTQFSLMVTLYCAKINGQIYNEKSECFSADDIFVLNKRLNNKKGDFYNDRGIWDALCRVERGKVSNRMRFSIYERDGHKCCKCGIAERYAQLEIDHIIPISKGGKSTYDNLQTLCHKCNVEKGDSFY